VQALSFGSIKSDWDVFLLFAVPIGGGIPAGVLLAQSRGIGWLAMSFLYLVSDIVLACLFEPFMMAVAYAGRRFHPLAKMLSIFKETSERTIARYGSKPGPVLLVAIAFGVDPMTGRAAALANGHGFLSGWAIAIVGDMLFFLLIMGSTIWLNNVLGDGTYTAIIIMTLMIVIPPIVQRVRKNNEPKL
jgi:hypothetical protein